MLCRAAVTHERLVAKPVEDIYALLTRIPDSAAHFPRLSGLDEVPGGWLWTLSAMGVKGIELAVSWGLAYTLEPQERIGWAPLEGVGNSRVTGAWTLLDRGEQTLLRIDNELCVDIPAPRLIRKPVEAYLAKTNQELVHGYLGNLVTTFAGGQGKVSLQG
jgi:hypothetical protein